MPGFLTFFLNPYDRKARLRPALLCALPVFVSVVLMIPDFGPIWAAVGGLILYCGGTMFLTQIGRDRGKALEPMLFQLWGGKPSVAMLRHRDTRLPKSTKKRYHAFLNRAVPGLKLASLKDEQESPEKADDGYEGATSWLLANTRDRELFDLIFRENINYGFRRNIWALKPWAFVVEGLAIFLVAVIVYNSWTGEIATTIQTIGMQVWMSVALIIVHIFAFSFKIRRKWIQLTAESYAQQLLAACDTLQVGPKTAYINPQ